MSVETWLAEFMPTPAADNCDTALDAVNHSLRKWTGMLPENRERHELCVLQGQGGAFTWVDGENKENLNSRQKFDKVELSSDTCSLCHFADIAREQARCKELMLGKPITRGNVCNFCPIRVHKAGDPKGMEGCGLAYGHFIDTLEVQPMLDLLIKTKELVERAEGNKQ